ncbi:potassium-transporting ATPase subunit KdpC [Shinella zoogloeoides]|uniref:Potassium-transporting ATPase KdpC subunit n=1 Tax=Shinella zoogloeoides TaxID=352475 RepID=A0A6N8TDA8_SHIZO|nr:potassium-transporting ATPase subunit KdpC [Shinella zoogloeoides]MXO00425.1 potassium-transporting ATPase subunit KdpC [Shinella zoogloeoides]UEX83978.1 potassium-transporting ATPase subunit KdpC [Shinella zoogloeoides]
MLNHLRPAITLVLTLTALLGLAYPLAVTGVAQAVMPAAANGSLIERDGAVVGSALIGQSFTTDRYFWPRPSATGPNAYNAASSSGSNLGTTSARLKERVAADVERLKAAGLATPVPADAVTTSGSGLDPHVSPAFARAQIARVAKARGLSETDVATLVESRIEGRLFGFIGEPRVNVLQLNLALDAHGT